jgi:cellulose synthase/poly-beta-1,6-N-acetylglucosamine synthase-like glycosyltransferase
MCQGGREATENLGECNQGMRLSIVVCAYNEERSIGDLLENISRQKVPSEITECEILVVASGCTDKTVDIAKHHIERDHRIKLIEERARLGKASALNRALELTSGDYIVLVPADVHPADGALFNLLIPFRDRDVSAVSGHPTCDPEEKGKHPAKCLAKLTYRLYVRLMAKLNDSGRIAHCSGEFMAIRKDVKTTIPPECAADDSYIAIMARKKGVVKFASNAVCFNLVPSNIVDYVNQRRRWLFGHFQTKKMSGEYPSVMDTIVWSKPTVALQVVAEEISESPKEIGYALIAVIVEAAIYLLSVVDHIFHRQYGSWAVIRSTKYASEQVKV